MMEAAEKDIAFSVAEELDSGDALPTSGIPHL
jgi:hypothetical protein